MHDSEVKSWNPKNNLISSESEQEIFAIAIIHQAWTLMLISERMSVVAACPTLQTHCITGIEGKVTLIWLTIVQSDSGREAQCIQEHASNPFSPQAVYHSISCLLRVWLHPYSDGTNSTAYLTSSPPKAPRSLPPIHTYINTSLWKQVATAHPEGDRIKITLNSKQRIEALADRTDSDTGYSAQLCVREKKRDGRKYDLHFIKWKGQEKSKWSNINYW